MAKVGEDARLETWTLQDGTHWPTVDGAGQLEWLLRYGEPDRSTLLLAAAVLHAYQHLIAYPTRQDRKLAELRRKYVQGLNNQ